jgi:hypothetical protein
MYRATEKPSRYWIKVKNSRYSQREGAKNCSSETRMFICEVSWLSRRCFGWRQVGRWLIGYSRVLVFNHS